MLGCISARYINEIGVASEPQSRIVETGCVGVQTAAIFPGVGWLERWIGWS